MPSKRKLTMRQIRQMLRLARDGTSAREIAERMGVARSTIQDSLKRAATAGLSWPLPGEMTDEALEVKLFIRNGVKQGMRRRPDPRRPATGSNVATIGACGGGREIASELLELGPGHNSGLVELLDVVIIADGRF